MRILVTGAAGAIGRHLVPELEHLGHDVTATDVRDIQRGTSAYFMDVRSSGDVWNVTAQCRPEAIIHLAASKLAVEGELAVPGFVQTNILGTLNIVDAAKSRGAKLLFASTCKAADPETVYGACKLIAERAVLSAGGTVMRFYNILACGPSVANIWAQIPAPMPIPYTDCTRYFISPRQAVELVVRCLEQPPGRYAMDPGPARHMRHVAQALYPGRRVVEIPRRRGDRAEEPLHAKSEYAVKLADGMLEIVGAHDPERARLVAAA